ncbi:MAG TPA: protein-disulfide reductase DsbD [Caldimonas sp.]|nr:protein-disulfide reductase DsbD [Caldimonas sp.]HEX4233695.1 protein-disulfide reductase DsbD [Caldimonas sp.]
MQARLFALAHAARFAARRSAAFLLLALLATFAVLQPAHAEDDFLPPEQAFRFSARPHDAKTVEVNFAIAPGYYLYREQFKFAATGGVLGAPAIPPGKVKFDETFQKNVETYRNAITILVPVEQAGGEFRLAVTSQGCADAGLCYPPMQSVATIGLTGFGGKGSARIETADGSSGPADTTATTAAATTSTAVGRAAGPATESSAIEAVLRGGSFWPIVGAFFIAGLLLSLTPCVLPMLPIVSSIIVGQAADAPTPALAGAGGTASANGSGGVSRSRGFALAASYSFGMAVVYTAFGVAAGLAGEGLAAALQNPWVLGAFALGLVALSLSMFGVYNLQLPSSITGRVTSAAQRLPAGKVAGVCAMGGVSALIVSPCVAAPLAGALLYLSQTHDVWLGGTALFSLAAGMSVPLLLVGASAGALLPRAGAWMVEVKAAFGVLLLGVALWTVQPILAGPLALALWGLLALFAAALLVYRAREIKASAPATAGATSAARLGWRQAIAALLGLVGVLQVVGAASGATDPLQPLARFSARSKLEASPGMPRFQTVSSVDELDAVLKSAGRPAILDFYADWCVSCKEMERFTFTDSAVQKRLAGALLLKADVTANNAQDRELLKRFNLFGPPGTIFFDASGREIRPARLIGYQNSGRFLDTLETAGL